MKIISQTAQMAQWSEAERRTGRRIVLVPTMGFLHEGHLSLVREAAKRGDRVVVSIFVNPAQFAPAEDFAAYPRDLERDHHLLHAETVDVLFEPAVEEIYPDGHQTHVEVARLSKPLCGALRPGHFQGVATVVAKLFNVVRPHAAVFGEKDYQQLQIVRQLVRDMLLDIEIIGHPIVREADGLAMSSRNAYLSADERKAAVCLSRALFKADCLVRRGETSAQAVVEAAGAEIDKEPLARVEYIKLADVETLCDVEKIRGEVVLALAVRIGKARLIDNRRLRPGRGEFGWETPCPTERD